MYLFNDIFAISCLFTFRPNCYIEIAEPQGANQALLDAVLLARKLHSASNVNNRKKHKDDTPMSGRIAASLAQFEDKMFERSSVKVKKSADAAKFLHTHVAISEGNVTRGQVAAAEESSTSQVNTHSSITPAIEYKQK